MGQIVAIVLYPTQIDVMSRLTLFNNGNTIKERLNRLHLICLVDPVTSL
jgi:hypothetical protein